MNDMPRITPKIIPPITREMIKIYDDYTHLTLDRRYFMQKLTKLTGSAAAAAAIVPMLAASKAKAAIVAEDDPRLKTETITWGRNRRTIRTTSLSTESRGQWRQVSSSDLEKPKS